MPGKEKQHHLDETESDQSDTLSEQVETFHQILYEFLETSVDLRHTKTIKRYFKQLFLFFITITFVIPFVFDLTTSNTDPIFSFDVQYRALVAIYVLYILLAFIIALTQTGEKFIILLIRTLPIYIFSVLLINFLQIFFDSQNSGNSFIYCYMGSMAVLTAFSFIVLFKKNKLQQTMLFCIRFFATLTIPFILMAKLKGWF